MRSYTVLSDAELLSLLKNDDVSAFEEIMLRFRMQLLAIAVNRLPFTEDAEECVQDVFFNIWNIRHKIDLQHSLNAYLSAAVRNRVYNKLARSRRNAELTENLQNGLLVSAADADLLYKEVMKQMDETLKELPEKCEMVFRLSKFDGLSNAEIAEMLDISTKSVEAYLTKAKKVIIAKFTRTHGIILAHLLLRFWLK